VSFLDRVRADFQIRTCLAARQKVKTAVNMSNGRSEWVRLGVRFATGLSKYTGVLVLVLAGSVASWGQATAQIHGTVQDSSGAAVPGANVTATQTDTAVSRTTIAEADGSYVLTALPLGPYTIQVSREGFTTAVEKGIDLQVSSDPMVRVTLEVGTVTQTVSVEANALQVETRGVGVGTTLIETQRILELPLNGRQVTDLITLSGLAVQTDTSPGYNMPTGVNISVAGGLSHSIQYNLDGASHLDTYDGTNMPLPFPDALQEFRLVTSTQDASGGGHSGASVNAVTKSGTNVIHGDAFEFFRNAALNGKDFFATQNDQLKRNQFGGVIGGPIKKDKLFFFAGYQGTRTRQSSKSTIEFVPTAAMQTGDFSAYIQNNCGPFDPNAFDANNHLKSPLSPAAVAIAAKLPKALDACGTVQTGAPLHENDLQVPARIDYHLSDKQSLFARYLATRIEKAVPYDVNPSDLLTTSGVGNDDLAQSLTLGHTYVFSPSLVNSFRLFGNRIGGIHAFPKSFTPQSVGLQNFYGGYTPSMMSILLPGAFQIGFTANFLTTREGVTNFGLNDDVTWIRGSHEFSFGGSAMHAILNEDSFAWAPGVFIFAGVPSFLGGTGSALGDFLVGTYTVLHQANPNPNNTTQHFFGLYAEDSWKATSRLTLNYGVRWNPFFPMQFIHSDVYNFSLPAFFAGTKSTVIPTAPPGFSYPGDPGFPGRAGLDHKLRDFEPRFGFAWDPSGTGKMAIRGGAGIAYDFIRQDLHQNTSSVAPFRLTVINNFGKLDDPYAKVPGGNPFPYTFDPKNPVFPSSPLYQGFYPIPRDLRTAEQYSWNLGIQRQVTPSLFASATYVGTQIIHTWTAIDLNPGQFIPGTSTTPTGCPPISVAPLTFPNTCALNVNQRRLLELMNPSAGNVLGSMTQLDDGGTQHYHGLLLNATWRKGNVNLAGNFTWSRCIGLAQIGVTNIQSTYPHQPYQNNGPINKYLDYGDCFNGALDIRREGNVTLVVSTPKFSGAWASRLGTGWTFSTIVTARSGWPLTVDVGSDVAENGLYQGAGNYPIPQRPNQVLANTASATRGQPCLPAPCISYFNSAAFAPASPGSYGNMGVGSLRSPGFWEWDQTISRQFKIKESQSIEIRAEAFNVTNSVRFYIAPTGDNAMLLTSPTFGNITEAASTTGSSSPFGSGGRIVQLAFKYIF
jgi:Carboxypeptidase regulatory-like domain/TonB dependent receptor